jgi:hypothetical protein
MRHSDCVICGKFCRVSFALHCGKVSLMHKITELSHTLRNMTIDFSLQKDYNKEEPYHNGKELIWNEEADPFAGRCPVPRYADNSSRLQ